MKKLLLTISALSMMLSASAAKRLTSITNNSYGSTYVTSFTYDEEGRLSTVKDEYSAYTFDYSKLSEKKVTLTRVDEYETTLYEMTLNDEGYVVKTTETYNGVLDEDYCTFEYAEGRLVNYKQVRPEETEESKITYDEEGKVVKVENLDGESESENETLTFEYNGVLNTGNLAFWDGVFSVDLDDMEYAAMAGLMGKCPAQLPVKCTSTDIYGSEATAFSWTPGEEGYPAGLVMKDEYDNEEYVFGWEAYESGVNEIASDVKGISRFFNANGIEVNATAKGLVIERKADGTATKRFNR